LIYKRRYFLREKETKRFLREIAEEENIDLTQLLNVQFEVMEFPDDYLIFLVNGNPFFVKSEVVFPTLINDYVLNQFPSITVDMGAVPYICNGADVMAPGIVKVDGKFNVDDLVVILDENFSKKIAVCKVLYDSCKSTEKKHGKVAQNLHHINDKFWETFKLISKRI
jgi:PUA domain protein